MDVYKPLRGWSEPASIPQIVAHIQKWLEEHPYIDPATVAEIVKDALENNPDVINGNIIPIDENGTPTIKGYIDSNTDILTLAINAKPDADNVYTKPEINYQMGQKANADSVYTKAESNALLNEKADKTSTYTKTETDTLLSDKANKSTTYTKTETDTLLANKADKSDTYTKTETNNLLSDKADKATTYTKTEMNNLLSNKADKATTYTKTETDNLINQVSDKIIVEKKYLQQPVYFQAGVFEISFNVAKTGYSAVGVVGWSYEDRSLAEKMSLSGVTLFDPSTVKLYGSCSEYVGLTTNTYVLVMYSKN